MVAPGARRSADVQLVHLLLELLHRHAHPLGRLVRVVPALLERLPDRPPFDLAPGRRRGDRDGRTAHVLQELRRERLQRVPLPGQHLPHLGQLLLRGPRPRPCPPPPRPPPPPPGRPR